MQWHYFYFISITFCPFFFALARSLNVLWILPSTLWLKFEKKTSATNTFAQGWWKVGWEATFMQDSRRWVQLPHNQKLCSRSQLKITCIGENSLNWSMVLWGICARLPSPGSHWIGGEGGGQWGRTKNGFGTTPYFLVIADDQEGWEAFSEAFSSISSFLIWLLAICEAEKIFCTKQEIWSFLVNFSFLDSALKSRASTLSKK